MAAENSRAGGAPVYSKGINPRPERGHHWGPTLLGIPRATDTQLVVGFLAPASVVGLMSTDDYDGPSFRD